ncbi:MAG: hypothetical protein HY508_09265 [Acidobacteria bacterium]|nr:hypothetical protein [Acidobacteriota bacterium]
MMRSTPADLERIESMFDWNDPNRYEWTIRGYGMRHIRYGAWGKFLRVGGRFIGPGLIIPGLGFFWTFILLMLVPASYEQLAGMAATISLIGLAVVLALLVRWGPQKKKAKLKTDLDELLTVSAGAIPCIMGMALANGFKGNVESLGQWLLFFLQEAIGVALLEIPEIFNFRAGNIEENSWYARLGLVFFRILIAYGLISSVITFYQRRFQQEQFIGTVKECFRQCQHLLDRDTLQLKREGRIHPLAPGEPAVPMIAFVEGLDQQDYEDELAAKRAVSGNARPK